MFQNFQKIPMISDRVVN